MSATIDPDLRERLAEALWRRFGPFVTDDQLWEDERRDVRQDWREDADSFAPIVAAEIEAAYQRGYDDGCDDPESVWTGTKAAFRAEGAREVREAVESVLDEDVTPSLNVADWCCDPLPSCPQYAHVNPSWLRAIIAEARAIRAALSGATDE